MTKRRGRKLFERRAKRARISSLESDRETHPPEDNDSTNSNWIRVGQEDTIENKVDIIIRDSENKSYRSLTIWGTGLGVEKTIAVVEALKRNYLKHGTRYSQETSIKAVDNDEPYLQVILTLLAPESSQEANVKTQSA